MQINEFNYYKPQTKSEALELLDKLDNVAPIAGGSDLLVEMKQGIRQFDEIVSLTAIEEFKKITEDSDFIYIGPLTTHTEIGKSELLQKYLPGLVKAASGIGTHQIRNTGTIGGNLCTCASCADTAPALIAYNTEVEISSKESVRLIQLNDFMLHHHQTALKQNELMTNIKVPKPSANTYSGFEKFGLRASASISVASVAVSITVNNNLVDDANIVIGACAPTPIQSPAAVNLLLKKDINELKSNENLIMQIADAAASDALPIDDIRASEQYRKDIIKIITKNVLLKAVS